MQVKVLELTDRKTIDVLMNKCKMRKKWKSEIKVMEMRETFAKTSRH